MRASTWLVTLVAVSLVCCDAPPPSSAAQSVLSRAGPLPVRGTFTTASEHQLMILSGSAWTDDTDVDLVVDVLVDGALVARGGIFSNAAATHRALVFPAVPLALAAGEHVVEIRAGNDETVSDAQDRYEITLVVR